MQTERYHAATDALLSGAPRKAEDLVRGHAPGFAEWARDHRLGALLYANASPEGRIRGILRDQHLHAVADELARSSWVPRLLSAAAAAGVQLFVFKGLGVAHDTRLYSAPAHRPLGDLDLLVSPDQLFAAIEVAVALGFDTEENDPAVREFAIRENYQVALQHPRHGLLEIHHQLYRDVPEAAVTSMRDRAKTVQVYGQDVQCLADPDLFYVLAVHLTRSDDEFLWSWLVDLRQFADVMSAASWIELRDRARDWGGQAFVAICLTLLEHLWGFRPRDLPPSYEEQLDADLRLPERRVIRRVRAGLPDGRLGGDELMLARRLARRPVREESPWRRVVCHPGVVCREMGVRSDDPWFTWHRIRHAGLRTQRILRAALGITGAGS